MADVLISGQVGNNTINGNETIGGNLTVSGTGSFGGASIAIGTNPASVGAIRLANNVLVWSRNAANNGDLPVIGTNASDQLLIGDSNYIALQTPALKVGGSATTVAGTGLIRLANNTGIYARNAANSADIALIRSDASNYVQLGNTNNPALYFNTSGGGVGYFDNSGFIVRPDINGRTIIREYTGNTNYGALYFGNASPSSTNYTLYANSTDAVINAPTSGGVLAIAIANTQTWQCKSSGLWFVSSQSVPADGSLADGTCVITWNGTNLVWKKKVSGSVTSGNIF